MDGRPLENISMPMVYIVLYHFHYNKVLAVFLVHLLCRDLEKAAEQHALKAIKNVC